MKPCKFLRFMVAILLLSICCEKVVDAQEAAATVATNPSDLQALHELMTSLNSDEDWLTLTPDPCVSGPQGIFCEPDPLTGALFVTTLQFGFLSAIANIIPCSPNATIPSSIANFTKLTTLSFTSCFTNKQKPTSFPPSLPVSLRLLTFTSNPALTGPIPPTVGSLQNLQRLVLSQNGLQGEIPSELGGLRALVQLDLSHNELSGAIPESLGSIEGLVNLDLRWNKLQGVVPMVMSQGLNQLQRLALSNNRIESIILPPNSSSFRALTFLDLSWNELRGELPAAIGSLSRLEDLFLNSNRGLNGTIPSTIGKLASLVRLDLSNCGLEGSIPEEVGELQKLRFFSVSRNKLSGGIPESLASLPVIFTLNLEGNQLSGAVPFSASFMQKMGPRNLVVKPENAGLCSHVETPQGGLLGLEPCPENGTAAAGSAARAPTSPSPNGGNPLRASTTVGSSAFIVRSVLALMTCCLSMIM